jgi:hypothetical protein
MFGRKDLEIRLTMLDLNRPRHTPPSPSDSTGIVWLRLLQLRRMRKEKYLVLGNEWLTQHGVDRFAKSRALRVLEKRGLIRIVRSDHRSPRVHIVRRAKRRVLNPQQRGAD